MFRSVLLAALLFTIPAALVGCVSDGDAGQRLGNEDVPESFQRAQGLENQALGQIEKGNRRRNPGKRREHIDRAIALLREARGLYEDELVENKGTYERRKTIESEMERLSDEIASLHKVRPVGE